MAVVDTSKESRAYSIALAAFNKAKYNYSVTDPKSPGYKSVLDVYNKAKRTLDIATTAAKKVRDKAATQRKVDAAQGKSEATQESITKLEEVRQKAAAANQETAEYDQRLKDLRARKTAEEKALKEAKDAATVTENKAKAKAETDKKVTSNAGYIGYKGPTTTPIKTEGPFTKDGAKKDVTSESDKTVTPAPRTSTGPQRTGSEMGGPGFDPDAVSSAQKYADAIAKAYELYQMPDIIFKNVPSLGKLLQRYLDNKLTLEQFQQEVGNDIWFRKNSVEIKNRWVQKFNYDDLVTSGQAQGTTNYEQSIAKIARDVQVRARAIGAVVDDTQAKQIAEDLYIYNQEADDTYVTNRLSGFIRSQSGMIGGNVTEGYSGQALQNYQALQASAKANGFKLEDILPKNAQGAPQTAQQVLQGLATGTIDSTRLQQDVRKLAAQGQPQYVRDLLGQGYDLETIYAPYKQRLASVLELNPDQVQLNDPSLRQAITDKGDMNLYDFERALRKDGRWQYTTDAKKTVSDSALSVLRDFGFQG
jgi:hypothetical protein